MDWHPWGDGAFERARREDRPGFLSIGYSAFHWCRVMERESFDDEETARLLNSAYVCAGGRCLRPVTSAADLADALSQPAGQLG